MKPLGIVLLFINLLAAAGVAYLAAQSWSRRQEQNTAVFRQQLALAGLPTDPADKGGDKGLAELKPEDTLTVNGQEVRAAVLTEYFTGATRGGDYGKMTAPRLTVAGEVGEMKKVVDGLVAAQPTEAGKLEYLVLGSGGAVRPGPLLLLADDFEERTAYREWLAEAQQLQAAARQGQAKPEDAARLTELVGLARSALDAKFGLALDPPNPSASGQFEDKKLAAREARDRALVAYLRTSDLAERAPKQAAYLAAQREYGAALGGKSAALSQADRRRWAAALMAVLDPSAGGQKRTALLVGLKDYHAAVTDRIARLLAMPSRYERQGDSERATFTAVYKQKLTTAQDLDILLDTQVAITKAFAVQERQAAGQVQGRTKHRDDAQGRVADLDAKAKAVAAAQADLERQILALQMAVGARFDELFLLEDQVFQAEKLKAGK